VLVATLVPLSMRVAGSRRTRARVLAPLGISLLVGAVGLGVAIAPPSARARSAGAMADRDGWWNRAKGSGPVPNSPALPFPVPDAAIAVAALNGEPDKVAAVGVAIEVGPGTAVRRLVLRLKEAADAGATVNPTGASVVACPIVSAWSPVKDGDWGAVPAAACALAASPGRRGSDGTWEFDLTAMAQAWLVGSLPQHGVLLHESAEAPSTFQVSWGDRTTPDLTFALEVAAEEDREPSAGPENPSAGGGERPSPQTGDGGAIPFTAGSPSPLPSGVAEPGGPQPTAPLPAPPPRQGPGEAVPLRPPKVVIAGNLPPATALLVPLALGVALLACYALGPAGDPVAAVPRRGGVGRALDRRAASGTAE
jgi:hypothetical protein